MIFQIPVELVQSNACSEVKIHAIVDRDLSLSSFVSLIVDILECPIIRWTPSQIYPRITSSAFEKLKEIFIAIQSIVSFRWECQAMGCFISA